MEPLALGVALGLGAGISPGPLLALVLANSLRGGFRAGALTAMAPLVTDALIIALSVAVLAELPARVLAGLGIAGGCVVIGVAVQTGLSARQADPVPGDVGPGTVLVSASLVNVLSPHPWLFWLTVGGPLLIEFAGAGAPRAAAFLVGFYALLVGAKLALAGLVATTRHRLSPYAYRVALLTTALVLLAAGVLLLVRFVPGLVGT